MYFVGLGQICLPRLNGIRIQLAARRKKTDFLARRMRDLILGGIAAGVGHYAWKRQSEQKRLRRGPDTCRGTWIVRGIVKKVGPRLRDSPNLMT